MDLYYLIFTVKILLEVLKVFKKHCFFKLKKQSLEESVGIHNENEEPNCNNNSKHLFSANYVKHFILYTCLI